MMNTTTTVTVDIDLSLIEPAVHLTLTKFEQLKAMSLTVLILLMSSEQQVQLFNYS